ncbi:flagellar biosynthesis anti-sigma factor FlgM [Geopseudomonas aromaticivorans]|uniref:flagellar biosynthesis anti-sigma factor FlgM n=1 Tax=Geopseudomonas aromaticivorans TaxID=2849492 RepID=UPI00349E9983
MKIDSSHPPTRPTATEGKEASARALRSQAKPVAESPSTVSHLSAASGKNATQDVDPARVAEIRQAILEGRLQISAERIADGLIASVREQLEHD